MPKASKFSPDEGITIYDLKDSEAVHYGEQSKGYVGKNLLQNKLNNGSSYGLTRTVNSDKSVLLTGTPSQNVNLILDDFVLSAGTYKISDGATGQSGSTFKMAVWTKVGDLYVDYLADTMGYKGDTFTLNSDTLIGVMFTIYSGFNTNNKLLYPMLRLASIPDSTYEPYLTPNTEIDNKVSNKTNGDLGAKNLLPFPYESTSKTDAGVTFTVQSDGGIKIEGETTDTGTELRLMGRLATDSYKMLLNTGQYILSNNFDLTGTGIEIALGGTKNNAYVAVGTELRYSKEVKISVTNDSVDQIVDGKYVIAVYIRLANHKTYDTVVYPMVRYVDDNDDTYHKYAMTNSELTKEIKYCAGDTIELSTMYGYVTSGTSQLYCNISGKFDTKTINSVQITGTDIRARGIKGYIKDNNGVTLEGVNFADYLKVDHFDKYNDQLLIAIVTKTNGAFQNLDNNTPITITSAKFTITLS